MHAVTTFDTKDNRSGSTRLEFVSVILAAIWLSATPALGQLATAGGAEGPVGRWLTDTGNLEVEIARCGEVFCGNVVKVLANRSMSGGGDMSPADSRSPLGLTILKNFAVSGEGEWQGEIYNRENGKTYACKLLLSAPDQLTVRPYVGLPLFGKTLLWTRVAVTVPERK